MPELEPNAWNHALHMQETDDVEPKPVPYPLMAEDTEIPWMPTDPIPNPEPETPGLGMPDPGIYEANAPGRTMVE